MSETQEKRQHFIRQLIREQLDAGEHKKVITRFPPEPNGYLHIGHAKSICLNFGMADEFDGQCYLRFDDTNPIKEEDEYVKAIEEDVRWLGFNWGERLTHTSDHYQTLYDYAEQLIQAGKAYVDSLSLEQIREYRGTLTEQGKNSPYRTRTVDENLTLFRQMKAGQCKEGEHVLRAKIDMGSANINMRDPVLYRIRFVEHQRTGSDWCIYPMYDFAHSLSDALECITHSLCTLEFQDHRPLYDWFINNLETPSQPVQTEFSRLNLSHTITSKRKLKQLVDEKCVDGWDDPRLPTIKGMRARGYPAKALRDFCEAIGISRSDSVIDMGLLEECVRDELNKTQPRAMAVLDPIKVIIENFPADKRETLQSAKHPDHPELGKRHLPFSRELYIERDDFMESPPSKYFRLSPGKEVRLRNAYIIKCTDVVKDENDEIVELRCSYDENTLGKKPEGRKVKGVIHWVEAKSALPCKIVMFDRLFNHSAPASSDNMLDELNPESKVTMTGCVIEAGLIDADAGDVFQFERQGYFCRSNTPAIEFHSVVGLRDNWNKKV